MTSHELAKYLLQFPDLPVVIYDETYEKQILATDVRIEECDVSIPPGPSKWHFTSKSITAIKIS